MQSFKPSEHTQLINLSIALSKPSSAVRPVLLEYDYELKVIGYRIPIPRLKEETSPDVGYSSSKHNSIFFIECKSGAVDNDKSTTQPERFEHIQSNPMTILSRQHPFDVKKEDLTIDFAILCSDKAKIESCHNIKPISFPILHYDTGEKTLSKTGINNATFKKQALNDAFSKPIKVNRETFIYLPFDDSDVQDNMGYILKNVFLPMIKFIEMQDGGEMPSIEAMLIKRFPIMAYVDEPERRKMVKIIERMLKEIFPDGEGSEDGLGNYLSKKNGKLYIKDTTLPKFIEKIEIISKQIEENGKLRKRTFTTKLEDFDQQMQPEFSEDDKIALFFDGIEFNI